MPYLSYMKESYKRLSHHLPLKHGAIKIEYRRPVKRWPHQSESLLIRTYITLRGEQTQYAEYGIPRKPGSIIKA